MNKCLLFDCDNTLVDSERLCNIGLAMKFDEHGITLDVDELVERFRGWKLATILSELANEYQIKLGDDFVTDYRNIVTKLFESELKPIAGIEKALKDLDFAKAVVSSGPLTKIKQALRISNLTDYFGKNLYSSYEVKIWKPEPGIYEFAAKDMGYAPDQCIVIDDSPVGIEAGYKAGMKTLFFNRLDELCPYESVISFTSMHDLPGLIQSLS